MIVFFQAFMFCRRGGGVHVEVGHFTEPGWLLGLVKKRPSTMHAHMHTVNCHQRHQKGPAAAERWWRIGTDFTLCRVFKKNIFVFFTPPFSGFRDGGSIQTDKHGW